MQAYAKYYSKIIEGCNQFIIPIYQRNYNWGIEHCRKLLDDILSISEDDNKTHFIGAIVYYCDSPIRSGLSKLIVIDGQQRLTTISLLVFAAIKFMEDNNYGTESFRNKLKDTFLYNSNESGEDKYKLVLVREDKVLYYNLLTSAFTDENQSHAIIRNFRFFYEQFKKNNIEKICNGIWRLILVETALDKGDNPQLIFESMNSTGLDLTQADLIRNYLLMGRDSKITEELYLKYWLPMENGYAEEYGILFNRFVRDYLTVKTQSIPKIDRVYEEFKNYAKDLNNDEKILALVKDIAKFNDYYCKMVVGGEEENRLATVFTRLSTLKADVIYPFLLPIYEDYKNKNISLAEFEEILLLVESYVFRRSVCGIPTNSMNKTFANLYKNIDKQKYFESIKVLFILLRSYQRFPTDSEFQTMLIDKQDFYKFNRNNYFFDRIENYGKREYISTKNYTIEHVLPQNKNLSNNWKQMLGENWSEIQDNYIHKLGNLTLTGYNSKLSDKDFIDKKTIEGGFDKSPLMLNEYFKNIKEWNKDHIEKRATLLAEKAIKIWSYPEVSNAIIEFYNKKSAKTLEYGLADYGFLVGNIRNLYDELKNRILELDNLIQIEYTKLYIAYKLEENIVDVIPQRNALKLSIKGNYKDINDPEQKCRDVKGIGRWGNGDIQLIISNYDDIEYAAFIIQQAYDNLMEGL